MGNTKEGSGGKFRAKKTYFSMVSNNALRDPELSLRATTIYNAVATCDVYFTTRVNRDLYEMKKP